MSQQKTPLRPNGLVEWAFLLLGTWSAISFLTQLLASYRSRISWLDLLIAGAAFYYFGIRRGWLQQITTPSTTMPQAREDLGMETMSANAKPSEGERKYNNILIHVPKSTKFNPDDATSLIASLDAFINRQSDPGSALHIETGMKDIRWRISVSTDEPGLVHIQSLLSPFSPTAKFNEMEGFDDLLEMPYYQRLVVFQANHDLLPLEYLKTAKDIKLSDPLRQLTNVMQEARPSEFMQYSVYCGGAFAPPKEVIDEWLTQPIYEADPEYFIRGTGGSLFSILSRRVTHMMKPDERRVPIFSEQVERAYRTKLEHRPLSVLIYACFKSQDQKRLDWFSSSIGIIRDFARPDYPLITGPTVIDHVIKTDEEHYKFHPATIINERYLSGPRGVTSKRFQETMLIVTPEELAALWHLPYEGFSAPKIGWVEEEKAPLPAAMHKAPEDALLLGYGRADGKQLPARMLEKDRAMHMIITGQINMGKSTLMHNLIHQDIEKGRGVALIDPKGDLFVDVLQRSVKAGRENDVVVWDLADTQNPPPLNFLLNPSGVPRKEAITVIMAVFEKIYGREFASREMAETLQRSFETIMVGETPTLRDVNKLLTDLDFREELISKVNNPAAAEFWDEFDAMGKGQGQFFRPVLRRLRDLYGHELLYPILCNPDMLNFRQLMEEKKIILISLNPPKELAPPLDDLNLLGSLLVSEFQLAVSSTKLVEPFYLYVDEAHRFVTSALDQIFLLARARNLHMILATQYPKQLPTDTLQAILENVGATVAFKCAEDTARIIKGRMEPQFETHDLINLDKAQAAARIFYDEKQMPPFLLETMPPPPKTDDAEVWEAVIRRLSDERSQRKSREEILKWLNEKYPRQRKPKGGTEDEQRSQDEAYKGWGSSDEALDDEKNENGDENTDGGEQDAL